MGWWVDLDMVEYPKTAEDLANDYSQDIKDWIQYNNTANLDASEFVSSFYEKVLNKQTLKNFDPEKGWEFKTWLSAILKNHYIDLINKSLKDNWISIDSYADDKKDTLREDVIKHDDIDHLDAIITKDSIKQLIFLINKIDIDRDRVLIKLKFYQKGQDHLINFDKADLDYIMSLNELEDHQVTQFIDDNVKESYGLKDKDICQLLNVSSGSINTLFQRAVRKWLKA